MASEKPSNGAAPQDRQQDAAAIDATNIVFNVQPGKVADFLAAYEAGPFKYLTTTLPSVRSYNVSVDAPNNKVITNIVFKSSEHYRKINAQGSAEKAGLDAATAGPKKFVAGPPQFTYMVSGLAFP